MNMQCLLLGCGDQGPPEDRLPGLELCAETTTTLPIRNPIWAVNQILIEDVSNTLTQLVALAFIVILLKINLQWFEFRLAQ